MTQTLKITEVYKSIQGESSYAGMPCTFVRLTGCPLRCRWCDTAYAFKGGEDVTIDQIIERVHQLNVPLVELTGGEPLAQEHAKDLVERLYKEKFKVLIETSGSELIKDVVEHAHIIMDLKCPDSGMADKNNLENLDYLKSTDEIKFVLASRKDFEWACVQIKEFKLERFNLLMSCAFGLLKPADLAQWMLDEQLVNVRMQLQQHKYIWSPRAKGV
jgi:7-carboxy-7-deazaguanine synthase